MIATSGEMAIDRSARCRAAAGPAISGDRHEQRERAAQPLLHTPFEGPRPSALQKDDEVDDRVPIVIHCR
jgi:hypothetical protein